jgi:hypothetical protein
MWRPTTPWGSPMAETLRSPPTTNVRDGRRHGRAHCRRWLRPAVMEVYARH